MLLLGILSRQIPPILVLNSRKIVFCSLLNVCKVEKSNLPPGFFLSVYLDSDVYDNLKTKSRLKFVLVLKYLYLFFPMGKAD